MSNENRFSYHFSSVCSCIKDGIVTINNVSIALFAKGIPHIAKDDDDMMKDMKDCAARIVTHDEGNAVKLTKAYVELPLTSPVFANLLTGLLITPCLAPATKQEMRRELLKPQDNPAKGAEVRNILINSHGLRDISLWPVPITNLSHKEIEVAAPVTREGITARALNAYGPNLWTAKP
ncbi:MAG: hypothetical protein FWF24_07130 [Alphaproteobacteria bacterium]|nr:hypothetical protein [Alphaproteobacteria bacterium]